MSRLLNETDIPFLGLLTVPSKKLSVFGVFSLGNILNLRKTLTRVTLISKRANRMPTQFRGPSPNGMYVN